MNTLIDWDGMSEYAGFKTTRDMIKYYMLHYNVDDIEKKLGVSYRSVKDKARKLRIRGRKTHKFKDGYRNPDKI